MFLINSRSYRFTVAPSSVNHQGHPLSRTYGVILQSSLTSVLPSALDYSSRLPVSVLVRLPKLQPLEAFLGHPSDDFVNISALGPPAWFMWADFPIPPPCKGPRTFLFVPLTFRMPSLHRSTSVEKLATEAPVNGGRNYDGPKVAKFLVG